MPVAKILNIGSDQTVLLPEEFWFDVDEVNIRRDERTGNLILCAQKNGDADFSNQHPLLQHLPGST